MVLAQLSLRWDAPEGGAQRAFQLGLELPSAPARPLAIAANLVLQRPRASVPPDVLEPRPRALQRGRTLDAALDHERADSLETLRTLADQYAGTAAAKRTRLARSQDWNAFQTWCDAHALCALPAAVDTLRCYLAALAQRGLRASTIRRARCSIGLHHEQHGLPRPDRTCRTRQVERGIARSIGTRELGATPVLPHELTKLVEGLGGAPREVRDRALLLLGFAGGFRSGELVALQVEDLTFTELDVEVRIRRGKEDQLGRSKRTVVPRSERAATCPVRALERWLERVGRPGTGPLFRRIDGAHVRAEAMSERATSRALQRATARAGFIGKYSSHSLRAGLCTSAYVAGRTIREIADHCRMECPQTVYRYLHPGRVPNRPNVAAGLL